MYQGTLVDTAFARVRGMACEVVNGVEATRDLRYLIVQRMKPQLVSGRVSKRAVATVFFIFLPSILLGLGQESYVERVPHVGSFQVASAQRCSAIAIDTSEYAGVVRAANDLKADVNRVTGCLPELNPERLAGPTILVGTLGKSKAVDQLALAGKIDVHAIAGKWESFVIQTVMHPFPGVESALVIAGSDKRGTIYGIYDLSEQMGVSPWYWWADVPVVHRDAVYVKAGRYTQGEPAVRYRGIFLNDEAPSLSGWTRENFGGYNHKFYVNVFELLLRLKGNYLWPAMWGSAFNEDDPENAKLADEYGIVMGTSHHEPMLRAQQEWKRHGKGPWNYATNAEVLRAFWDAGVSRNKDYESIVTIGMRGDGDMPMVEGGDMAANVALLEKIVADQRRILAERVNPDVTKIPQSWALYKEVQSYYEHGMRVPDDVTLLWCDDNWGNVRRLPTADEKQRAGGAGIYYHFDYVGDPRNYKWLNTVPITKVWEQMNLAYEYDARRIWIVNVGDLKPMEFPIEYFLTLAWNPKAWPHDRIEEFGRLWAERDFGPEHAAEIADLIAKYTKYNGRRKPELLEPGTFSLENYQEAIRIEREWDQLTARAEKLYAVLPATQRDAFFELVLYPVKACAIVNRLYLAAARNNLYAAQQRASANEWAEKTRQLFQADADWSAEYNHKLAGGRWDHMMDQTHIGYTYWQQPEHNNMPKVVEVNVLPSAALGVAVEGSREAWPADAAETTLLRFVSFGQAERNIDVFNRGREPFEFSATASSPWIIVDQTKGTVGPDRQLHVHVDWAHVSQGEARGSVTIAGAGAEFHVPVVALKRSVPANFHGFVEGDGVVSIEAEHYAAKSEASGIRWERIADYGRTLSSMTVFPVTAESLLPPDKAPSLEYRIFLFEPGSIRVDAIVAPTLNFVPGRGLRYAIAIDGEKPQAIDILEQNSAKDWGESVKDSVRTSSSEHVIGAAGAHTIKIWMVDPGVVLQKLVIDAGGLKPSYLGPPESIRR